jgi:PAS domain S-box-containing protein
MTVVTEDWFGRRLVEAAPDAIIFADREGTIGIWNGGAERIFGYTAAEAIGQSLDLIVPERFRQRHWEGYRRVMATGQTRYGSELLAVPAVRKDGTPISLEFSIALLHDADGTLLGIAAIMRDVTARWQEQRAMRARLAALEAEVEQLKASAAAAEETPAS